MCPLLRLTVQTRIMCTLRELYGPGVEKASLSLVAKIAR